MLDWLTCPCTCRQQVAHLTQQRELLIQVRLIRSLGSPAYRPQKMYTELICMLNVHIVHDTCFTFRQ